MNEPATYPSFDRLNDNPQLQSCLPSPLIQPGKEDAVGMVWLCFKVALCAYLLFYVGLAFWPRAAS